MAPRSAALQPLPSAPHIPPTSTRTPDICLDKRLEAPEARFSLSLGPCQGQPLVDVGKMLLKECDPLRYGDPNSTLSEESRVLFTLRGFTCKRLCV